jgi:hypothetical protein
MTRIRLRYINEFIDRHGHVRRYFRRRGGGRPVPLPGLPGSSEFMAAYQAALGTASPPPPSPNHIIRGSLILPRDISVPRVSQIYLCRRRRSIVQS